MGIPQRLLGENEHVVFHLRTHIKRILGWLLLGLLVLVAAIVGTVLLPAEAQPIGSYIIWGVCVVVLIPVALVPWLKWLTTTYSITDRRVITRTGIFNKRGHDIPLRSISNVAYERSFIDRIFRCGTLVLETSADNPLRLDDIPNIEHVHVRMTELLHRIGQGE
ncbi:PH domain-containing protein [Gulosibacter sp. ACHW.36C]|uniref:PH domain-containing protein n=1 Tax=Gulosibacter sediminis TaxID=1729695 RepID=A0ABY4MZY9_9MICO|nr:PH domain-containing protein [Gulosibacter sediminis]UQN16006.1 PH domain-containing protein [Gulosibacter sediminis]